ncbi:CehA/McbA family metallohydrolase [Paenibacillus sepulcri]|uniref:CehA/McbA family metallohydrolase n=1 Tax=Paenibacillus sepulcri TaxID=359917 RepID=A0ABS7BXV1_9BACL|nr:CehA/McbA family metallohydrolase [Paenibacillus sepulcri]
MWKKWINITIVSTIVFSMLPIGKTYASLDAQAGQSTEDPGFTYDGTANTGKDVAEGDTYYYLQNDEAIAIISNKVGGNNKQGSFKKGWPVDFVSKDPKANMKETLDWSELVLSPTMNGDYNQKGVQLSLDNIQVVDNDKIVASGQWDQNAKIKGSVTYQMLPDQPVMKMTLTLNNQDTSDFAGYFLYSMDPDVPGAQSSYAPGIGWLPGLRTSGWSENYLYDGTSGSSGEPAHSIAWLDDQPTGIYGSDLYFGAWFDASVKAGESKQISWYHVTEIPSERGNPYDNFSTYAKQLSVMDPEVPDYSKVTGQMTDPTTDAGIPGVTLVAKNINSEVAGTAVTDAEGKYELYLPANTYTLTASRPGYEMDSNSVEITTDSTIVYPIDFEMNPISVSAGTGVRLPGTLAEGTVDDVVIQNSKLAMTIAKTYVDSQLTNSVGRPIDFAVQGLDDDLDWINLPYLRIAPLPAKEQWKVLTVNNSSVDVTENTAEQATVKVTGTYSEVPGVNVETTYSLQATQTWIDTETVFKNTTASDVVAYAGDVMDHDGEGQTSFVPGVGTIPDVATYTPNAPWFSQYGSSQQAYGIIYEGDFASGFTLNGNNTNVLSEKQITIPAGGEYRLTRHLVAASTEGLTDKSQAINNVYDEIISHQTGISMELAVDKETLSINEPFKVSLTVKNDSDDIVSGLQANLNLPANVTSSDMAAKDIPELAAHSSTTVTWNAAAAGGGHGDIQLEIKKSGNPYITKNKQIFVNGPGWYAGDNHTHSRYSDGSGSINDNATVARNKGLDFLTATDHNSIKQKDDVAKENRADFVELLGEEVTTGTGHSLAYDISSLINWAQPTQDYINETRANNDGQGMHFIAHPYYPGLEWEDWSVKNYNGIEVWNGFYPPKHTVNAQAFAKWDELNKAGRHIIGLANSDAHNPGKVGDPHIKAYMDNLSKEEIYQAIRGGMLYGTNGDIDLELNINGKMIGSDVAVDRQGGQANIVLNGSAPGGLTTARVIKNGVLLKEWTGLTGTTFNQNLQDNAVPGDFYRMELEGANGKFAFSNPIWITDGISVPQSMSFDDENVTLRVNKSDVLSVTGTYLDASKLELSETGKLAFISSDSSVVSIDSYGHMTGLKTGKADITASIGNLEIITTVTVVPNKAPAASTSEYNTAAGTPINGVMVASDEDRDQLAFRIVKQGTLGQAAVTDAVYGGFTYTPNPGITGTDTFTFIASDGEADSQETAVTVNIKEVPVSNQAPVAEGGTWSVAQGGSLLEKLKATDPDNDKLTYSIVANGTMGTATVIDAVYGGFSYTPNIGAATGTDMFSFKVNDGSVDSNTATITVHITPGNHLPKAENLSFNTTIGIAIDVSLKGTDSDGDPLTYTIVQNGTRGSAVIKDSHTGSVTYTPNDEQPGEDTFVYMVNDGKGNSNPGIVSISIKLPGPGHPDDDDNTPPADGSDNPSYPPAAPPAPPAEKPPVEEPEAPEAPASGGGENQQPTKPVDQLFTDVSNNWAKSYIQEAVDSGLISGYPDGTFKPNETINRAEFLVILTKAMGYYDSDAALSFADQSSIPAWSADAIKKAIKAGIIKGYDDNTFRPGQIVSRSEMVVLLARALGLPDNAGLKSTFGDAPDIPVWAQGMAEQLKQLGIIQGRGNGEFAPKAGTTRAEAIKVILTAMHLMK